ncbi:hypothetical protein [Dactylosporangium sp. CS-033363]|uniref:hypothetical protein n=1 Tax=Dactylosporangium sp. CS-033363 TaxID=3239935 RepID=UPI003D8FAE70
MSEVGLGLGYWLPRTRFAIAVTPRTVVRIDEGRSHVEEVQDVRVTPAVVQDPASRHTLTVRASLLETVAVTIELDDRGFIQSINSRSGKDYSPIVSLVGKAVGLAATFYTGGVAAITGDLPRQWREASLEDGWNALHPGLADAATALAERTDELLARLGHPETTAAGIAELGRALDVLQQQLAAISEARRGWIAGHARTFETTTWQLAPAELLRVAGPGLPDALVDPPVPPAQADMSRDWHVLLAIADPDRPAGAAATAERDLTDHVALRRSRPVTIGVYRPHPGRDGGAWHLDPDSPAQLDIVDELSVTDLLPLDGSWHRDNKFVLAYHPDMSLKSFGIESAPAVAGLSTSIGEVLDAVAQARKDVAARPSAEEEAAARAKTQLELLQSLNSAEILAATRARSAELAALEQQKKLREAAA